MSTPLGHSPPTSFWVTCYQLVLRFTFDEHSFWFQSTWRQEPPITVEIALLICLWLPWECSGRFCQLWFLVGWTPCLSLLAVTGTTVYIPSDLRDVADSVTDHHHKANHSEFFLVSQCKYKPIIPWASLVAQLVMNPPAMQVTLIGFLG